ncbi:outer membrane beta-barrel family protein [Aestuariibaculum lutulentum]|uniref:TonB-dependent receptor family protein n=1 Tax=Aestuariibaculum lutulentum TaxID=2920935 RepID=A0ABS9RLG2_9FLAO|nr:outer membrane beta-barrel family protein [Aestuariibaculum lutulentum]MCH4553732.1 TonB-dependent receptor family protein [Aestuariibaculum lutulentum]
MSFKTVSTYILFIFLLFQVVKGGSQNIEIKGVVIDEGSKQPLSYATIVVANRDTKQAITGAITTEDGSFSLKTKASKFYIEVSFIGFLSKTIEQFNLKNNTINLGTIGLQEDASPLDEVVVQAETSRTEFKLDRRVFNVGKDISSTGMSALEVLNNVPSVSVNIEGIISLRGSSGVQILINGKPSILTGEGGALGSITADMIESIEVITNPSAKYDAEGTSGIINIIIKKEERKGVNGSLSLNTGIPDNHSVGLSLNRRSEKFNLFTQLGIGRRSNPNEGENINTDLINKTNLMNSGKEYRNEKFYNIILGTDYYINPNNVVTLSGNFAYEVEDQPSNNLFKLFDETNALISEWNRTEETEATNPKWQYELQYKKDFEDHEDHDLLFSALGQSFAKDQSSLFNDVTVSGEDRDAVQRTRADFSDYTYTFKLDYTKPFSEQWRLETGAQYVINDVSNDYEVENFVGENFVTDEGLTNIFNYNQNVFGIYATGSFEGVKWGLKTGLRMEQTDLKTLLANTNEANNQNYLNLFPSLHTSYKISDMVSLQAGYSKRIYRPRLWDLNPFFNMRNSFSIRQGNPNLMPEFTDSYELTSIFDIGNTSLNFGVYHRYTTDVIERITTSEDNVNITRPENIGANSTYGIEFNTKYSPINWLTLNADFNYNTFKRDGSFEAQLFDFKGNQWTSKLMGKFKMPADIDFEATGNYLSKYKTVQSVVSDMLFLDLGLRKKIMKGRGVLNVGVRDVFASRIDERFTSQNSFLSYSKNARGRFVTFGFSYGFGKGEAMEYSGGRRHY